VTNFGEFYQEWRGKVAVVSAPETVRGLYFQDSRDDDGFDLLPEFFNKYGEEWAVTVAGIIEQRSGLASSLDEMGLAKLRMIVDRHLLNVTKTLFDESYHKSSDERSLFLVYHKISPAGICSAMARAKNATFDMIITKADGNFGNSELALISAFSTLFTIEINQIMRAYIYFEQANKTKEASFEPLHCAISAPTATYEAPKVNGQMSLPKKTKFGAVEMF